ncbi:MAG: hypothetical protein GXX09_03440 [Syntrophomonadaceae bacterium]|nr:hypothetical protein [Syntrophomonadaceae bacterium]
MGFRRGFGYRGYPGTDFYDCPLGGFDGIGYFDGVGGFDGFAPRQSFFALLFSLLNFNVSVLTEGDVAPVVGILVGITPQFITIAGGTTPVTYIPISQITLITRVI